MYWRWFGTATVFGAVGLLAVVPVAFVVVGSFDQSQIGQPFRFGLNGWSEAFSNPKTASSIAYSFILSARIPLAIAIAFPIAWALVRWNVPFSGFIEKALWFGFFLPIIPLTMGWVLLLDESYGLLNQALHSMPFVSGPPFSIYSIGGIIWVHLSATTVPLMVILLKPAIQQIDGTFEEAARCSGAGPLVTLRRVTIPLLMPTILTAFIAGLIRSLEVYEVEQLLGTPKNILVYSTRIVDLINQQPPALSQALSLSSMFLILLFLLAYLYQLYLTRIGNRPTLGGKGVRLHGMPSIAGWCVSLILLFYIAATIVLPLTILVLGSFKDLFGYFSSAWTIDNWALVLSDPIFARSVALSLLLGIVVAGIGVLLYALLSWLLVRSSMPGRSFLSLMIWLPWAIPGIVLGLALLTIFVGSPMLQVISGTFVPIILALMIKDMPFAVHIISTAIRQISVELEEAAAMAGAGYLIMMQKIMLPLLLPTMASVMVLVFVGCLRDISTITLLAGPGIRTMSLLMFEYATNGKFEAAAVVGIILSVLSLAATIAVFRLTNVISMRR